MSSKKTIGDLGYPIGQQQRILGKQSMTSVRKSIRLNKRIARLQPRLKNSFFVHNPTAQCSPPHCPGLVAHLLGSIIGCCLARANASVAKGDLPSVRITEPIDMKKLLSRMTVSIKLDSDICARRQGARPIANVPKCNPGTQHVFS